MKERQVLGLRIKELREKAKMTQDTLAELVGIDPKHLSRIENGRNYPSLETLERLIYNLDVNFEDIFNFEHITSREQLINKIGNYVNSLPDDKLKFIFKVIKEI